MSVESSASPTPAIDLPATIGAAAGSKFKFTRIYTGEGDRSYLEQFDPSGDFGSVQAVEMKIATLYKKRATKISINTIPAGSSVPYHTSADTGAGVLLILLRGLCVFWVDDDGAPGRSYYPHAVGGVFLCEDTHGRGHGGLVLEEAVVLHIDLAPDLAD